MNYIGKKAKAYKSVKFFRLESSTGNPPVKAFDDRWLKDAKMVIKVKRNGITC